ncbi:cytochrome P450 [Mycena sp. CBHHK59/15]|nr:cytochrome P450 [Mycena sp. CBHHK59/15]
MCGMIEPFDSFVIPEGTTVIVPPYVILRDPRYFSPDPEKFWPFSTGPANCARKNHALLELRMVLAYMKQVFEVLWLKGTTNVGGWTT